MAIKCFNPTLFVVEVFGDREEMQALVGCLKMQVTLHPNVFYEMGGLENRCYGQKYDLRCNVAFRLSLV